MWWVSRIMGNFLRGEVFGEGEGIFVVESPTGHSVGQFERLPSFI